MLRRLCLFFLLGTIVLAAGAPRAAAQVERTVRRSVPIDPDGRVEMSTFTGRIQVTAGDGDRVEVEARIEGEDAELVEKTALTFDRRDGGLSIEVDYDEVEDSQEFLGLFSVDVDRPAVHFTVEMPRTARLFIEDFNSDIRVEGLRSDVTVDAFSSSIQLRDVKGHLAFELFSGSVDGTDLEGSFDVDTFSGDARLQMRALSGESRIDTFSGDVDVFLPAGTGFVIASEDGFGDVQSEFALRDEGNRRIAGSGGPTIELSTFSGDLRLREQ